MNGLNKVSTLEPVGEPITSLAYDNRRNDTGDWTSTFRYDVENCLTSAMAAGATATPCEVDESLPAISHLTGSSIEAPYHAITS